MGGCSVYVRLPVEIRDAIRAEAASASLTMSDVVRAALVKQFSGKVKRVGDHAKKR
jgi:DICT domain-containing protein